jgi:hypothetical protein
MQTVTALLINPYNATVIEVPYSGSLKEFEFYTASTAREFAPFINAGIGGYLDGEGYWVEGESPVPGLGFTDSFVVDDDAPHTDNCHFFSSPFHSSVFAGIALIVGVGHNGELADPEVTYVQVVRNVVFLGNTAAARRAIG